MTRGVVGTRDGIRLHYRRLGRGPGLVLLHGYPQTGHMWRKVMPVLAEQFTVVAPDLRGYGDSDRPAAGYDKRTMAADVADVIAALGLAPVTLVGHDRGARVAHRLALDHPALLTRLVLLDIAPTYDVFERTDRVSARARWHWFFHQVPDLPEALTAGREDVYLRFLYRSWAWNPAAIEEEAIQEYLRCFRQPGAMRAGFEDYRAAASLDFEHDGADRDRKIGVPTLVLWGGAGRVPQAADMLGVWRARCAGPVTGHAVPDSGHFIPEEQPQAVVDAILAFAGAGDA
ncbi:MAG: alpha/beta hydrolase [Candidatus Rokubacteria bacterium RIFCSPHIGHO2_12_FULL_73_22]|nr:MAG: alpha/beta hydrolase [Candidatus Rokubacteria bacterium RIFCSPHIGHO2_02_FULL_73_26]OGK98812.1 MAG: alpha/beta hydrolase [Candidatus Rokubacteria bacterium RIFCSPHIGHO2_12_FULL_73_22]OGL13284.1 MAG: alpha/beta hydrolase [Candidatus Rokubacteria bacterium RIFCSPLOWO2_02_FULL_73_56]OGL24968.1 MAG: alpha/beta hydrolase [Candidatus Rokubacteria bacterium RIFCSPLOWO2_12_FULL_73_47]